MLQGAHVLATQAVVGNPFFLVVVFGLGQVADMDNVHVHARKLHLAHHAPTVDGWAMAWISSLKEVLKKESCSALAERLFLKPHPQRKGIHICKRPTYISNTQSSSSSILTKNSATGKEAMSIKIGHAVL
jgi:hypothetical protein